MGAGYAPGMKLVVMDRCRFPCMSHEIPTNPGSYEDLAHSNLVVTTVHDIRITTSPTKDKFSFFSNKKGGRKRVTFEHL